MTSNFSEGSGTVQPYVMDSMSSIGAGMGQGINQFFNYLGSFPGIMMFVSVLGLLLNKDDAKNVAPNLLLRPEQITKGSPAPFVVGTFISTNNCIWLDVQKSGLYPASYYGGILEETFVEEIDGGFFGSDQTIEPNLYTTHFVCLSSVDGGIVNNTWFDGKHWWMLMRLDDFLYQKANTDTPHYTIFHQYSSSTDVIYGYMHHAYNNVIEFEGIINDPAPQKTIRTLLYSLEKPEYAVLGNVHNKFPNIKTEVTGNSALGGTYAFKDSNNKVYSITYRDNENDYSYALTFESVYDDGLPRFFKYDHLLNEEEYLYGGEDLQKNYDDITKGYNNSQKFWRQDIDDNPDHMYFFLGRNYHWGGSVWQTHHVPYSLEYDIFYLDRSDNTIHSVIRANRITINGQNQVSNAIPPIYCQSMEVVGDEILVFGWEYQSWNIMYDYRYMTEEAELIEDPVYGTLHRIYADWSGYPDNYWVNMEEPYTWFYFTKNHYERRKVIHQTSTYIDVQGEFGCYPKVGNKVCVTRKRSYQADWGYVGEGSTRDRVIVVKPDIFNPQIVPEQHEDYDRAYLLTYDGVWTQDWEYEARALTVIADEGNSWVDFGSDSLHRDPVVGDKIFFTFSSDVYDRWDGADSDYYRYYNPTDEWFYEYLFNRLEEEDNLPIIDWDIGFNVLEYNSWFNTSLHADGFERLVVLRFNKNTGAYLGKLYQNYPFAYNAGADAFEICIPHTGTSAIHSVSTDSEIAVTWLIMQTNTQRHLGLVINKSDLSIKSYNRAGRSQFGGTNLHLSGHVYRGAVKAYVFDLASNSYQWRWYALLYEYLGPYASNGAYILDLGTQGIFPAADQPVSTEEGDYSSTLAIGVNVAGLVKWYRRGGWATGPLYTTMYVESRSTRTDSPNLRKFDFDNKLIFSYENGPPYALGGEFETWCYFPPNEYNKAGYAYPLDGNNDRARVSTVTQGSLNYTIRNCKYACSVDGNHVYSYQCDANPVGAISSIISKSTTPIHYSYTGLYTPLDVDDKIQEYVPAKINYAGRTFDIVERRYLFSKSYEQRKSAKDYIDEVLDTFQGAFYRCPGFSGPDSHNDLKAYRLIVPTPNEPVSFYFGFDENTFVTNALSNEYDVIFINFEDYPEDYWKGDIGYIKVDNVNYEIIIIEQGSTYIRLSDDLPVYAPNGVEVFISKQNIKEGSFSYFKKSNVDRINKVRVEFTNRMTGYDVDIVEASDHYRQDVYDGDVHIKQMDMRGICRATQASRMAFRYLDYENYIEWSCNFDTDLIGYALCVGDIVGVTHNVTGWFIKLFRIKSIEEIGDDFECKLLLEEYKREIFNDYSEIHIQTGSSGILNTNMSPNIIPFHVRRLFAYYDYVTQRVYITFYSPVETNFWLGAKIYCSIDGGNDQFVGTAFSSSVTPNVIFSSTGTTETSVMAETISKYCEEKNYEYIYTEIPYDSTTMLGTFPASGYIWVNQELIYYNGIDTINNKFIGCVRCVEVPDEQYAVDAPDTYLNWTNPLITLANYNTFSFPVTSEFVDLTAEQAQTEGSQIEYDQPLLRIKAVSLSAYGEEADYSTAPYFNLLLRGPVGGRPYSPTLLRYERNL